MLARLLTRAVESAADHPAIVFDGRSTSYRDLDAESSQLARVLIEHGAGPGTVVVLGLTRSTESVLAVWAVAKTGAAFVPVDPTYPADRIAYMVDDSGAALGITVDAYRNMFPDAVTWLCLDDVDLQRRVAAASARPISHRDRTRQPELSDIAYVIYTSGSTGLPKGVSVTHSGLAGVAGAEREHYQVTSESRVLHVCSPSFDVSILELLLAFTAGATLVVAPATAFGGDELAELLRRERVTHMLITPGALATVDPAGLEDLRVVVVAGDTFAPELVARWSVGRRFHNGYGPTEATILATSSQAMEPGRTITIGTPLPGVRAVVIDHRLRPVPEGTAGELHLAGDQLAQDYRNQPSLTALRFVANPFGEPGDRMYRTGDVVRWAHRRSPADGAELEYLGRNDFQVKVRGFRIELGEIDAALSEHEGVEFAVTVGRTNPAGVTAIVSYVMAPPGVHLDRDELVEFVAKRLPRHMVPAVVMVIDEIPLTPVGKLDRTNLPEPLFASDAEFEPPRTPTEEAIVAVFAEVLGRTQVGALDSFFALGGDSLLATRVIARLSAELGKQLPVPALFAGPTPRALAHQVDQILATSQSRPVLSARVRPDTVPLSFAQRRMWFLNRFDPASTVYNIPMAIRLTGVIDVDVLRAAVADVVARHEVLRTRYPETENGPVQLIEPEGAGPDVAVTPVQEQDVDSAVMQMAMRAFDVTSEVPVAVGLFPVTSQRGGAAVVDSGGAAVVDSGGGAVDDILVVVVVNHIAGDGASVEPLLRDLAGAYLARSAGSAPAWQPLPVQYADYTLWQQELMGAEDDPDSLSARQLDYWHRQLSGLPAEFDFPTDHARPAAMSFRGAAEPVRIEPALNEQIHELARRVSGTPFMVLHAAFSALLYRLSQTRDVVIGAPVAGRGDAALDDLIGMFVNTVVLRTQIDPSAEFVEFLESVRETDVAAFAHSDVPFERLVEVLDPERSPGRHPLIQIALTFQNAGGTVEQLPGVAAAVIEPQTLVAKFDLHLDIADRGSEGLSGSLIYATDLFESVTAREFVRRLVRTLEAVVADPAIAVGDIPLMDDAEREAALELSRSESVDAVDSTLVDVFDRQVRSRPDAIAVRHNGEELSYAALDERSRRLARRLTAAGVGPGSLVAIAIPKSISAVVALLAVVEAGGAYLPLDVESPAQRLAFILDDADPVCVLTTSAQDRIQGGDRPYLVVDDDSVPDVAVAVRSPSAADTAYVIYTSGSTGTPKGVAVSHGNVVALLHNSVPLFDFDDRDVWTLFHSLAFDFSVWELWGAIAHGGSVVIVDHLVSRSPSEFLDLLIAERVTVLNQTPSAFYQLVEADRVTAPRDLALRYVIFGGEALDLRQLERWYDQRDEDSTRLVNMYGITETTVHVSFLALTREFARAAGASVIGRGLPGLNVYVLDERLRVVPAGVPGEMYVSGPQVSRGYVEQAGLTSTRFVPDPFGAPGARLYRTGDRARWNRAGQLEYAGRSDQQVQLRGFRIELGEVEAALREHPGVAQAVSLVRRDDRAGDRLIGYFVAEAGVDLDTAAVRSRASQFLPGYMVPDVVVEIPAIPLTANGKLDRNALPAPTVVSDVGYREPRTPAEQAVADVFAELLGVQQVGVDDNFFDLGGNSLIATRAVARINAALDSDLAIRTLFEAPTVEVLANRAGSVGGRTRPRLAAQPRPEYVPLSLAQQRMWVLNRLDAESGLYNIPLALELRGVLDAVALQRAFADVVERHEVLRTRYPVTEAGDPYQEILTLQGSGLELDLEETDLEVALGTVAALLSRGFDVTRAVPVRARLIRVATDRHVLAVVAHHIAADGASLAPLARDLVTAYRARLADAEPPWAPLAVQYADYALWQRQAIGSDDEEGTVAAQQLAYWREALHGVVDRLDLPTDRPRPAIASTAGANYTFAIPREAHERLAHIAHEHNASMFMVVHSLLAVLLARLSGSGDVAIGTPIAGRGEQELDDLVGMFVNTLALRLSVLPASSFGEIVDQAREVDLTAFANADLPFERLVEEMGIRRSLAYHPLFQTAIVFENLEPARLDLPDLSIGAVDSGVVSAKFDLQLTVEPRRQDDGSFAEIAAMFTYAVDLFDEATVAGFARRLGRVIDAVSDSPDAPIGDIDLLDETERESASVHSPDELTVVADGVALGQVLFSTSEADPQAPAIVFDEAEVTYGELDARSSQLARLLIDRDCGPGSVVAVALGRSVESVVAAWAALKAGAAIASIDPVHPSGVGPTNAVKLGVVREVDHDRVGTALGSAPLLVVDRDATRAEAAAQSSRPVTYASRVGQLTGADIAWMGSDGVGVSFDELAAAAERIRAGAAIDYESRVLCAGDVGALVDVLAIVVVGIAGAALVLDAGPVEDIVNDAWISHLITDPASLEKIEPASVAGSDLEVVIGAGFREADVTRWRDVVEVLSIDRTLPLALRSGIARSDE